MELNTSYLNCLKLAQEIKHPVMCKVAVDWLSNNKNKLIGVKGSDWQHHNYAGGLIIHIEAVTKLAISIAKFYENSVSMDLIIFCALMHDVGKVEDYQIEDTFEECQEISSNQELLGHCYEGARTVEMLLKSEFECVEGTYSIQAKKVIEQCVHCIGSHMIACVGPISEQKMLEVFIVGKADHIDAELSQTIVKSSNEWFETASGHRYYKASV